MKIEKWKYNGQEIDVPVFGSDEIETNEDIKNQNVSVFKSTEIEETNDKKFENTIDLSKSFKELKNYE